MAYKIIFTFSLLLCILVLAWGDLSLTSTALVQERQHYSYAMDNAAQAVLRKLSKDKTITKGSRVSKIDLEDTKVAESVLYSIGLDMDLGAMRGVNYELQFVQPISDWHAVRSHPALPAGRMDQRPTTDVALHGSVPTYAPPEITMTLHGPLELFFPFPTTELSIKTPRHVDVGYVDRIIVAEGANISLSGPVELRLRDSLTIDTLMGLEEGKLIINTKDKAKLNVYGHRIEIANASAYEQLKVNKKSSNTIEITPTGAPVIKGGNVPFEISLNDSRMETVKHMLQQLSESAQVAFPPKVRRITSGSRMEAVVSFLIPLELEDEKTGTSSMWDVVVAQGSNHKEAQVISIEKQRVHTQVTWDTALSLNGTLPDAIQNFQHYLQNAGSVF